MRAKNRDQQAVRALRALDLGHVAAAVEHDLLGAGSQRSTWRPKPGGISLSCEPQTNSAGGSSAAMRGNSPSRPNGGSR